MTQPQQPGVITQEAGSRGWTRWGSPKAQRGCGEGVPVLTYYLILPTNTEKRKMSESRGMKTGKCWEKLAIPLLKGSSLPKEAELHPGVKHRGVPVLDFCHVVELGFTGMVLIGPSAWCLLHFPELSYLELNRKANWQDWKIQKSLFVAGPRQQLAEISAGQGRDVLAEL